jgi:hypothetical protein
MDKIKVKLANPYLESFDSENMASSYEIVTFPSKPTKIEAVFPEASLAAKSALYAVTCEDGKIYPFGVVFLLAQITEVNEQYTKLFSLQVANGEISNEFKTLAVDKVLSKSSPTQGAFWDVELNRYAIAQSRSAVDLNTKLNRDEPLDVDFSYQLSWSDIMSTNAIDNSTFFNPFLQPDAGNDLTTPNDKYSQLSNWDGTSYNAFWCCITGAGQDTIEDVEEELGELANICVEAQNKAADSPA